jgi:MFS family permease
MNSPPGRLSRHPRVRAAATYQFRLGPVDAKWASTPFAGLSIVNSLSSAGDALVAVALAGSVFVSVSLNAARGRTALGLVCTVLPFAVVGPFVGPLIDRMHSGRRFIIFGASVGRLAACLMMATWIHSLLLFPAAFLSLVCSKTHAVAKASLVPGVVDKPEDLVRANSRLAVGASVATSIAAAIGALIYKVAGSPALLDFDFLVFALTAALSIALLARTRQDTPVTGDASVGGSDVTAPAPDSGTGPSGQKERKASGRRGPRPVIPPEVGLAQISMAGMRAVAGFLTALVVFGFRRTDTPVIWYGLVAVASVAGNFSGALVAPYLRDRVSEKRLVAAAALIIGAVAVAATRLSFDHHRPAALLLAAVIGLAASVAKTAFDAIVQRETDDAGRGRLFARFESIFQLVWVVGALIPVVIALSLFSGFVVVAIVVLATSAVFVIGVARDRRRPLGEAAPGPETRASEPARADPPPPASAPSPAGSSGGTMRYPVRGANHWGAPAGPSAG